MLPLASAMRHCLRGNVDMPLETTKGIPQHIGAAAASQVTHMGLKVCHLGLKGVVWRRLHVPHKPM